MSHSPIRPQTKIATLKGATNARPFGGAPDTEVNPVMIIGHRMTNYYYKITTVHTHAKACYLFIDQNVNEM